MIEAWLLAFVVIAGFPVGALGLLMIGHLMSEEWLKPIRPQAEAAALTTPLLFLLALPLAFDLHALYPWASGRLALPPGRAAYLSPDFFLVRSAIYVSVWSVLALWITHARDLRRASAFGLAFLTPTVTLAANDWVLSREPFWWSSLFGFAFAATQLLAALAGAILVSGYKLDRTGEARMMSLERALLTLALLALWMWFAQFLIVWLADLPNEAAWYVLRSGRWLWLVVGVALPALIAAVVILAPRGVSRKLMIAGSGLALLAYAAHTLWLVRPPAQAGLSWVDPAIGFGVGAVWAAAFAGAMRLRREGREALWTIAS